MKNIVEVLQKLNYLVKKW